MAPVIKQLERCAEIESRVCATAQHRQLLDEVLKLFAIKPDWDLDIMTANQNLAELTASLLHKLDPLLAVEKPDWVLMQGDTTTVMSAALAAFYRGIRIGHVEAGLRTGDKSQPFPEEINRRIAGLVAELHFAPTEKSRQNLIREGINPHHVVVTGNPGIDALYAALEKRCAFGDGLLSALRSKRRVLLVTAHRRENFGAPLASICSALKKLAEIYRDRLQIIYPVHLSPNVLEPVHTLITEEANISLLPPVDYLQMAHLLKRSFIVLTDSGGLQEEAPALGKPVLVLRDKTERTEIIEAGAAKLVGTKTESIVAEVVRLMEDADLYQSMAQAVNPYGYGHAAEKIVAAVWQKQTFLSSRSSSAEMRWTTT